jgi:hypothetical protein
MMIPVILESPYAGDRATNITYAKRAMLDSLARGEAPFASHMLYTQFLNDEDPEQRALGINAGLAWLARAQASVVYTDMGISPGMLTGIERARLAGVPVEFREIGLTETLR